MSPRTRTRTRKREKAAKHAPRFVLKVPQHEGTRNVYFVHDCSCGWQSPLCQTSDRAREAFDQHRGAA